MTTVLMPVLDAGSGHRKPAEAVAAALARRHPGRFQVEVVDPGAAMGLVTDRLLKDSWDLSLAHPWLARWGFPLVQAPWSWTYLPTLFRELQERGVAFLRERRPAAVFSTHFFWLSIAALARRRQAFSGPVLGYVIDPHRLWAEPRADAIAYDPLVMPDPERQLRGVPPARIRQFPFPVAAPRPVDRAAAAVALGTDPGRLTVLVSQGGKGIAGTEAFVRAVLHRDPPLNLLVACGHNATLQARLARLAAARRDARTSLVPLGRLPDLAEPMAAADVVVGKGGPSTTFEAVALGKPLVYTHWATYTERPLVTGMVARGCAWYEPAPARFAALLAQLAADPGLLAGRRAAVARLGFRAGGETVADWIAGQMP